MKVLWKDTYIIYYIEKTGTETLIGFCTSLREFDNYLDTVEHPERYILRNATNLDPHADKQ